MITIEQLAEKLGETVWSKGDLKRIYLNDAGFNTKKMSTKTFIWQDENGDFKVSCRIDCPSQSYNWIESQEKEVKESVYSDIEKILNPEIEETEAEEPEDVEVIDGENEKRTVTFTRSQKSTSIKVENFSEFLKYCDENNLLLGKIMTPIYKKEYIACGQKIYPYVKNPMTIKFSK